MQPSSRPWLARLRRPFHGWVVVGGAFLSHFLGYGMITVAFGIFFPYMAETLGWSRSLLSSATMVSRVTSVPVGMLAGPLVDRRGPRLFTLGGTVCVAAGALMLSATNSVWMFFAGYGIMMAAGGAVLGELTADSTVARWFVRRRGRALAFATMGLSAAGVAIPIPLAFLIGRFGWREAWIFLAAFALLAGILAALLMRRRPEDHGLTPDGDVPDAVVAKGSAAVVEVSFTARDAIRTSAFWLLLISMTFSSLALFGINLHLFAFLTDKGFKAEVAAGVLTYLYLLYAISKPLWGLVAERVHVRYCLAGCYIGGAVGVIFLLVFPGWMGIIAFATVYGLTRGAQSFVSSLAWADYFGRGSQGAIRGIASPFRSFPTALGPVLGGVLYDVTGNYTIAFTIFAVTFALGGLAAIVARPPRRPQPAILTA